MIGTTDMNTDLKVTSLELSKQLKKAGAKQESEYVWTDRNNLCQTHGKVDEV